MPIISKVEARSRQGKLVYALIILLLTVGGATMLYPFLIMVSGTLRSEMDERDLDLIPTYMTDHRALHRKFLETKYNQKVEELNRAHGRLNFSFRSASIPQGVAAAQIDDFKKFLAETHMPMHWQTLGGVEGIRTVPENLRRLTGRVRDRFNGDLAGLSRHIGATLTRWDLRGFRSPEWLSTRTWPTIPT